VRRCASRHPRWEKHGSSDLILEQQTTTLDARRRGTMAASSSSAAAAAAQYDVWCDARDGCVLDITEEAEAVEQLRRVFHVAFSEVKHASSPIEQLVATTQALLDDSNDYVTWCAIGSNDTPTMTLSKRGKRVLDAIGDVALPYLTHQADAIGTKDAEKTACVAIRAYADAASSPRDAMLCMLEMMHLRVGQLARSETGELGFSNHRFGWRIAASLVNAAAVLIEKSNRDPTAHVADAAPLIARVEELVIRLNITHYTHDDTDDDETETEWGSIYDIGNAIGSYKVVVLKTLAQFSSEKWDSAARRVALTIAAADPSPETIVSVANVLKARGVTSVSKLFEVSGIHDCPKQEEGGDFEEEKVVAGALVLANAWTSINAENDSQKTAWNPPPFAILQALEATWAVADLSLDNEVRGGLHSAALSFASRAFAMCAKTYATGETNTDTDSLFLSAAHRFETLMLAAPSPALRDLARVTHGRMLNSIAGATRLAVIRGRVFGGNRVGENEEERDGPETRAAWDETRKELPRPNPAVTALYLTRCTREIREAFDRDGGCDDTCGSDFTREYYDIVMDALKDTLREARFDEKSLDEKSLDEALNAETADVLVAGLNCLRFVLGRAAGQGDTTQNNVSQFWRERASILDEIARPSLEWATKTKTECAIRADETHDATDDATDSWRCFMGAEHVLETAGCVAELCGEE